MKEKTLLFILLSVLWVAGSLLLIYTDWKIFVGVFLLMWANNLQQKYV